MSTAGTKVVPIPGGEKLLSNVEATGRLLIDDYAVAIGHGLLEKSDLLELLEGHAQLGQAMVDAVARTRKKMDPKLLKGATA